MGRCGQTCGVAKRIAVPASSARSQSSSPSASVFAPSSPDGTTCEWQSTKRGSTPRRLLGAQVELERRGDHAQLAQGTRLELPDALARDAKVRADLFERLRRLPIEAEAAGDDVAHSRREPQERLGELGGAEMLGRHRVGAVGLQVLDQVAVQALAVADGSLQTDRVLDELQQRADALDRKSTLLGD